MFKKKLRNRRLSAERLEQRRLMTCDLTEGIYVDGDVLCIRGSEYEDIATAEIFGNPDNGMLIVELEYDPPGFDNDVLLSSFTNVVAINEIYFFGGPGNASDSFTNDTHLTSTAWGGGGIDNLIGGSGSDHFFGGEGDDNMYGEGGVDFLHGQQGDDDLYGGPGDDDLYGGESSDDLYGGPGNDRLFGQDGADTLNGGDLSEPNDGYVDELTGDNSFSSNVDEFMPEIQVGIVDGLAQMFNIDIFHDCSASGDTVVGYEADTANAFCDGESVELHALHLGPGDKTIETVQIFADPDGNLADPAVKKTTLDSTDLLSLAETPLPDLAQPLVAQETEASIDQPTVGSTKTLRSSLEDELLDWLRPQLEPLIAVLAADTARR